MKSLILNQQTTQRKLRRIALEVAERNSGCGEIILIGIWENGFHVARKIYEHLLLVFPGQLVLIECRIDKRNPLTIHFSEDVSLSGKAVLLIDDVANTGRTMLYALKPLLEQLPLQIETIALVERTHKKFPVHIDYVGLSVSTIPAENIVVEVKGNEIEGAWLR